MFEFILRSVIEDGLIIIIISLLYRSYCCCVLIFIIVVFCTYQIERNLHYKTTV